jgi:hypothetical protein
MPLSPQTLKFQLSLLLVNTQISEHNSLSPICAPGKPYGVTQSLAECLELTRGEAAEISVSSEATVGLWKCYLGTLGELMWQLGL